MPGSWIADPAAASSGLRVKICGITCLEDARAAAEAGADALGFNFWPGSKRALLLEQASTWLPDVPDTVARIAVVVNPAEQFLEALQACGLFQAVQFHGEEAPDFCQRCQLPWVRAFRGLGGPGQGGEPGEYATAWWLFDAAASVGTYGGTGNLADWAAVAQIVSQHPEKHIFLAGGLTPHNVAEAVRSVRPFAVDVAGGVERAPGRKDSSRMQAFVQAAKTAWTAGRQDS